MTAELESMARRLADALSQSEEALEYKRLKGIAYEDETNARLLDEYDRLQIEMQRGMISGGGMDGEAMQKFQRVASLVMMNQDAQAYLMGQMRMQQAFAQVIQIVSEGVDLPLKGLAQP